MFPYGTGEAPVKAPLLPGESIATAFIAQPAGGVTNLNPIVNVTDGATTPGTADVQVSVSQCPGDFSPSSAFCVKSMLYTGGSIYMTRTNQVGYCNVVPGNKYYMNVREVKISDSTQNSCPSTGGCALRVQIQANWP
jgi:hypothetical protein